MLGLLVLYWAVCVADDLEKVSGTLDGVYYNCSSLTPTGSAASDDLKVAQAREDCIKTGWCIWRTSGGAGFVNTCVADACLKPLADDAASITNCPLPSDTGYQCGLYYITDVRECGTKAVPGDGHQISYSDVYCRVNQAGYDKLPIDKCFYDDLANRASGGGGTCGNRPCGWNGTSTTESPGRFCRATDAQVCTDVVGDLGAFCKCLGSTDGGKFCNLHPNCILNGTNCIEDLCTRGTGVTAANCNNLPANQNGNECGGRFEVRINPTTGELETTQNLRCANKDKNKNGNTCFWGIDAKVETWTVGTGADIWPCSSVTAVNKCTSLGVFNYSGGFSGVPVTDTNCEIATIPSGWFAGTEICIDPGRAVPSVDAGIKLNVPSMLVLLIAALASFVL